MLELDGTPNKGHLGATRFSVSLAPARGAQESG